jgi:8-oxo-dGTP pyrophosphatase MutT (NUDIX family)
MIVRRIIAFFLPGTERARNSLLHILGAKSVGVRAIVLDGDNRVLLVKHTYRPRWHTPGGGVQYGESPLSAIRRELKEEVGLIIKGDPKIFGIYRSKWRGLADYPILYIVNSFEGTAKVCDPMEIADVSWFSLGELPKEITQKTKQRLDEFCGVLPISESW